MSTTDSTSGLDDDQLETIYGWVDQIPLSRQKKNITRDFSDGVLVAEILNYYFPRDVEMHNYPQAHNVKGKTQNWLLLNRKVLNKLLKFELGEDVIKDLCSPKPFIIEKVLLELKTRIEHKLQEEHIEPPPPISSYRAKESDQPEADQHIGKGKGTKGKTVSSKASVKSDPALPGNIPRVPPPGGTKKERDLSIKYEEKKQECLAKGETIAILMTKVRHLENLVYLRDVRTSQLEKAIHDIEHGVEEYRK